MGSNANSAMLFLIFLDLGHGANLELRLNKGLSGCFPALSLLHFPLGQHSPPRTRFFQLRTPLPRMGCC